MKKGIVEQTWKENKNWKEESNLCGFLQTVVYGEVMACITRFHCPWGEEVQEETQAMDALTSENNDSFNL